MNIDNTSPESLGFDEYMSDLQFSNDCGALLGKLELLVDDYAELEARYDDLSLENVNLKLENSRLSGQLEDLEVKFDNLLAEMIDVSLRNIALNGDLDEMESYNTDLRLALALCWD